MWGRFLVWGLWIENEEDETFIYVLMEYVCIYVHYVIHRELTVYILLLRLEM